MLRLSRVVPLLILLPHIALAQGRVTEGELRTLMNEQRRAVELYRAGRTAEALAILSTRTSSMNQVIARRILQWMEDPQVRLRDPQERFVQPWTPSLVAALASLQMEAALRAYQDRGTVQDFRWHVRTAQVLVDALETKRQAPPDLMARWILAIGATAQMEGQLGWAAEILDDACTGPEKSAALLIACGSVHEALARLPAHVLLTVGASPEGEEAQGFGLNSHSAAVARRNRHLASARRALERALEIDPASTEARLRLAHIHIVQKDAARGASLLRAILDRSAALDRRDAFLARLFLGAIHLRTGEPDAAVGLFRLCIADVPSAHSAYIALAHALHQTGQAREAAAVIEGMFTAPLQPPDPWGAYYDGQYWIPGPLIEGLRAEARR